MAKTPGTAERKPRGPDKPKTVYIVTKGSADDIVEVTTQAEEALAAMTGGQGLTVVTKTVTKRAPATVAGA